MQKLVTRVARESAGRIAALTATTGAVSSSRGPAHARAPIQQLDHAATPSSPFKDEWLITQVDAGNVLFRPEDIDEVANEVLQLVPRQLSHINSQSEAESDGQEATSIIEANDLSSSSLRQTQTGPFDVMMRVASELMKKPAVQKEVVDVILGDPDLLHMLMDKKSQEDYLLMWGLNPGLLTSPVIEEVTEEATRDAEANGGSPLDHLMSRLMSAFGKMGETMQHVVAWLKGIFQGPQAPQGEADAERPARPSRFFDAFNNNPLLKAAMLLGVMLVCVLLLRRPAMLAAVMRKKAATAAAAAAAAAGVAAVAKP